MINLRWYWSIISGSALCWQPAMMQVCARRTATISLPSSAMCFCVCVLCLSEFIDFLGNPLTVRGFIGPFRQLLSYSVIYCLLTA